MFIKTKHVLRNRDGKVAPGTTVEVPDDDDVVGKLLASGAVEKADEVSAQVAMGDSDEVRAGRAAKVFPHLAVAAEPEPEGDASSEVETKSRRRSAAKQKDMI